MNPCIPFRRVDVFIITAGIALFSVGSGQSAFARRPREQQTSQPQQNPQPAPQSQDQSAPKPKKVWSNDDVVSLRTPADTYQAEKEAQAAADAEAAVKKADLAKQIKQAGLTIKLPPTPEATQQLIKDKEEQIRDFQERLDRLNHPLSDAPASQKAATQEQIEALTGDVQKDQLELKVLQNHLEILSKNKPSEPPTAPVAPENP